MLKQTMSLTLAGLIATGAHAIVLEDFATEWGTIQASGPRGPSNGNRFLNAQGPGSFASDAFLRFDIGALKAAIPAGEGIIDIDVILDDAPAGFSSAGGVQLWHFTNDSIAITNGAAGDGPDDDFSGLGVSPLVYGDFTGTVVNFGVESLVDANETYTPAASGVDNVFDLDGPAASAVLADAAVNDILSFVVIADLGTAATYKGNDFGAATRPRIVITTGIIPEPASLGLFGLGLAAAARRRR